MPDMFEGNDSHLFICAIATGGNFAEINSGKGGEGHL